MLVVEGPDLVGKSTLVETLQRAVGQKAPSRAIRRQHFGKLPSEWQYPGSYFRYIRPWTICDRLHLSELFYGWYLRDGSNLSPEDMHLLDGMIRAAGGMVVTVSAVPGVYNGIIIDHFDPADHPTVEGEAQLHGHRMAEINKAFYRLHCDGRNNRPVEDPRFFLPVDYKRLVGAYNNHKVLWPSMDKRFVDMVADRYVKLQTRMEEVLEETAIR